MLYAEMEQALAQGLTRAIGVSDFRKSQVEDLLETANVVPAINQCQMSVGHHDDENIEFCKEHNITYEAWNVVKGCDRTHPTVVAAAAAHNVSTFQVCMRYVVDRGCVLAVGTGDDPTNVVDYTKENLGIFSFELTDDEVTALSAI